MAGPYPPPWRLRVFITYGRYGWSEVYWLTTLTLGDSLAAARDLVNRRRLWFGLGPYVEYAELSQHKNTRDTWAVPVADIDRFPPAGLPLPQHPNAKSEGWQYRGEAPGGRWGQRLFKGVPDDWIVDVKAAGALAAMSPLGGPGLPPIVLAAGPAGTPAAVLLQPGQTVGLLQRSLLDALVRYTGFLDAGYRSTDPDTWQVTPLSRVVYRQVSNLPTKHAYRRVSCEGGVRCVGGFWVGPLFSFCGMCVGVCRTAYYAPARWYVGGPTSGIRFYFVPRTNPVYFGQLRFGPKISEPNYSNGPQTGELTTLGGRPWYDGTDVNPARDGTHGDITPEQAAGQAPWIWGSGP